MACRARNLKQADIGMVYMMIDRRIGLHKLDVLALVVELGGVTRAADHLHVAQPVVSAHLRSLESRLGVRLFYREGNVLHLTQAGDAVYRWTIDMQRRTRLLDRELAGLSDGHRGSVVIGASMSIGTYELPDLVVEYRRRRPLVDIRVEFPEVQHAIMGTDSAENDFSVVVMTEEPLIESLESELIGMSPMVIVGPREGVIDSDFATLADLADAAWIEAPRRVPPKRRRFDDVKLAEMGLQDRLVCVELGHPEAIKRAVAGGEGLTLMFRSAVRRELDEGILREIHTDQTPISGPVHLLYRKDKVFSVVQSEFIEDIRRHYAPTLSEPPGATPA